MESSKYAAPAAKSQPPVSFNDRRRVSPARVIGKPLASPARGDSTARPRMPADAKGDKVTDPDAIGTDALIKLSKLTLRLHWKAQQLISSHSFATSLPSDTLSTSTDESENLYSRAQQMFRWDFFEFYVLLERAVVLTLALCGIRVSALDSSPAASPEQPPAHANAVNTTGVAQGKTEKKFIFTTRGHITITRPSAAARIAEGRHSGMSDGGHRFHANVLRALERESSPLREAMGTGDVRAAMYRAKDLRNAWKEEPLVLRSSSPNEDDRRFKSHRVGSEFTGGEDLEGMLHAIMTGLDQAEGVARDFVRRGEAGDIGEAGAMDWEYFVEDGWGAAQDEMEWE